MVRRLMLAALLGSLALAACSDAGRQAPSEGSPDFDKGIPCPTTAFPLDAANALIVQLYPIGTSKRDAPQATMLALAKDIAQKWAKCKVADPQRKVVNFVNTLLDDFRNGALIGGTSPGTAGQVSQLINVMYSGVGFGAPNLTVDPTNGTDIGVGFFTPGQQLLVQTNVKDGAVLIPADAFTEPTAITIALRPDSPNPFDGTGFLVYPPFFEITASNLSGTHYLANGLAVVGFCVDDQGSFASLNEPAIAHLAVAEGTHGGGFEILDDASSTQYAALGLDCEQFIPSSASLFRHGLRHFASRAPAAAAHALQATLASLFLPTPLHASLGKVGLGGLASSLSPFGLTDRSPANHLSITSDPSTDHYYVGGTIDTCHDGCDPEVELLDAGNTGVGAGISVTVSLVQTAGTGGVLGGTLTQPTDANSRATFSDLTISQPGTYKLVFSAPGAQPATSAEFSVYRLEFQVQPTATPDETVNSGQWLGQTVAGYPNPVVQVRIVDYTGATAVLTDFVQLDVTGGLTLNGTTATSAIAGVASFTEITGVGQGISVSSGTTVTGIRLRASVFDEPPVESTPFGVAAVIIQ